MHPTEEQTPGPLQIHPFSLSFDTQGTHTHTHALSLTPMLARTHTHSFQVKLINVFYVREVEKKLPIKQELSLHRQTSRHEFQKN